MTDHNFTSEFLNTLQERGFINQCTDFDELDKALRGGTPVVAYCGYDPTADSLHVGHLVTIMMLYWLQQSGHKPITLMGGATGLVGDPSFKDEARPLLSEEGIQANIDGIQKVFGNILDYGDGKTDAVMVNNADWLKGLGYIQFLRENGSHFSVNRMLSFESVKRRLDREQNLSFLEFNYMLMQAYDFVELYKDHGCTLQISGADQWGNIVNGIELGRRKEQASLFGLTAPLLTTASGKKMGKSEGNAVWLNPEKLSHFDFYQFWRNVEDADVGRFLRIFTTLPMDRVKELEALEGAQINDAKKVLAFEVTKLIRGEAAAKEAEQTAIETFEKGDAAEGLPTIEVSIDELTSKRYVDLFVDAGLTDSKGEARRLVKQGGARVNDEKMQDQDRMGSPDDADNDNIIKLSAGKKRHALIKIG